MKLLILKLSSVFVIAFALTTFLHELAHAITARIVDIEAVWYHSYVSSDSSQTSPLQQLFISAAGPLFSLLQAVIFLFLFRRRAKYDIISLFYLWMSIIGMVVFLGNLLMGLFVPYGDSGKVYAILAIPDYISYPIAALALAILIFFFRKITRVMDGFMFQLETETEYGRHKIIKLFFVFPLLIGTVINVLLSLPAPTVMSLSFPLVISLTMIPTTLRLIKSNSSSNNNASSEIRLSKKDNWPVIIMILLILISRILATGIAI